jgi:hypothetical protein
VPHLSDCSSAARPWPASRPGPSRWVGIAPTEDRHLIQAISDGLAGELYSEDGWIAKFSKFKEGAAIEKLTDKRTEEGPFTNESDRRILNEFGNSLMERVRDSTINEIRSLLSGDVASKDARALNRALASLGLQPDQWGRRTVVSKGRNVRHP